MNKILIGRVVTITLVIVMLLNVFILARIRMIMNADSILRESKASYYCYAK